MRMAAFQDAAGEYAAAGIVPLPIDGKRPLVKHPDRFRRRAALSIVPKFPNAALGFWCGHFNGLTVVDIDSPQDSELSYALDTFGPSPIIVRTASGKHHAWYRHAGERRRIRPDKSHPIDILGEGGIAVAPPSARPMAADINSFVVVYRTLRTSRRSAAAPCKNSSPHPLKDRRRATMRPRSAGAMTPCFGWPWAWPTTPRHKPSCWSKRGGPMPKYRTRPYRMPKCNAPLAAHGVTRCATA
jgi:Bifunctional DNA primase/polymerase, N-terminal